MLSPTDATTTSRRDTRIVVPSDDSAEQIKNEHQAAEVAQVEMLRDLHAAHQETAGLAEDVASIYSEIDSLIDGTCKAAAGVAAVSMRNETVKKLDALARAEESMANEVQMNLIENATAHVRASAPKMSGAAMSGPTRVPTFKMVNAQKQRSGHGLLARQSSTAFALSSAMSKDTRQC